MSKDEMQIIMKEFGKVNVGLSELREDVSELKTDMAGLKTDVNNLKSDVRELTVKVVKIDDGMQKFVLDQGLLKAAALNNLSDIARLKFRLDHIGAPNS
jgi:uncharacterized phage infection (PIP) family protein YhgE